MHCVQYIFCVHAAVQFEVNVTNKQCKLGHLTLDLFVGALMKNTDFDICLLFLLLSLNVAI